MVRTFGIAPASAWPFIFIAIIGVVLVAILGLMIFIGYSIKNVKFEISEPGLRIKGGLYGRFIPRGDIVPEGIRIINLNTESQYKPKLRTNGIGLPGYSEGWFKLRNNEKALLFVTDASRVAYLPTRENYSVLLSVSNTEDFFNTVKATWK